MANLNSLFEQIISTEQEYQLKNSELKELNNQIQELHNYNKQIKTKLTNLVGENVIKNNQYSSEYCLYVSAKKNFEVILEMKEKLSSEKEELEKKCSSLEEELRCLDNEFFTLAKDFSLANSINGSRLKNETKSINSEIHLVEKEIEKQNQIYQTLTEKETSLNVKQENIAILGEENAELREEVIKYSNKIEKLEKILVLKREEKLKLDNNLNEDSEYRELKRQLTESQEEIEVLDSNMRDLTNELEQLQSIDQKNEIQKRNNNRKKQFLTKESTPRLTTSIIPQYKNYSNSYSMNNRHYNSYGNSRYPYMVSSTNSNMDATSSGNNNNIKSAYEDFDINELAELNFISEFDFDDSD